MKGLICIQLNILKNYISRNTFLNHLPEITSGIAHKICFGQIIMLHCLQYTIQSKYSTDVFLILQKNNQTSRCFCSDDEF